jgi:hypothetical protein
MSSVNRDLIDQAVTLLNIIEDCTIDMKPEEEAFVKGMRERLDKYGEASLHVDGEIVAKLGELVGRCL